MLKIFLLKRMLNNLWPLDAVDPKKARFPCCIVWTPLPVVSWLAPYIGHIGICREDGAVLDFAGSNLVSLDNFAYGAVARYLQLDKEQCCFPPNVASHTCERSYKHAEHGTAISWDDALNSSNEHAAVSAQVLQPLHLQLPLVCGQLHEPASLQWLYQVECAQCSLSDLVARAMGQSHSIVLPHCYGAMHWSPDGWLVFLVGLASFSFLLIGWFVIGIYCMRRDSNAC